MSSKNPPSCLSSETPLSSSNAPPSENMSENMASSSVSDPGLSSSPPSKKLPPSEKALSESELLKDWGEEVREVGRLLKGYGVLQFKKIEQAVFASLLQLAKGIFLLLVLVEVSCVSVYFLLRGILELIGEWIKNPGWLQLGVGGSCLILIYFCIRILSGWKTRQHLQEVKKIFQKMGVLSETKGSD